MPGLFRRLDYDGAGRAATYTSAGETLSYTWNEHDRVERVERADGTQAQLSWNLDGRPAAVVDDVLGTLAHEWDASGDLQAVSRNGELIDYVYDTDGALADRLATPLDVEPAPLAAMVQTSIAAAPPASGLTLPTAAELRSWYNLPSPTDTRAFTGLRPAPTQSGTRGGGGGGVLGEYAMLLQWAVAGTVTIATVAALDEAIEVVATSISTRVPADHRPPTPVAPEDRPHTSSPPKPLPDEPPAAPDEDNDCRTTFAGPNEIDPRPTTTFPDETGDKDVASGVVALLSATKNTSPAVGEQGQRANYPAVGWGPALTERGHLIGKQFGGPDGVANVVAMWQSTNRGAYLSAEKRVKDAIERDCSEVLVDVTVVYHDGSESVEELLARKRLPADYFIFEATTDTGAMYVVEPQPILNRQKERP